MGVPTTKLIIMPLLEQHPLTSKQIAEETGLSRSKVDGFINRERSKPDRTIRICDWILQVGIQGKPAPVYEVSTKRDVRCPDLRTPEHLNARHARYREKHKGKLLAKERKRRGSSLLDNPFAQLVSFTGSSIVATHKRKDGDERSEASDGPKDRDVRSVFATATQGREPPAC